MNYVGIFQGGGVKAIAHLGAIKALEERGFRCVKAAGSSAGAIVASLLIVGYNADELKEIIMKNGDSVYLAQKRAAAIRKELRSQSGKILL